MLPNFIIVGAAKSGTTSLWHYLKQHPEIYMSTIKSPEFFVNGLMNKVDPVPNLTEYGKLFHPNEKTKAIGEASPNYLNYYNEAADRIKNLIPDCKIIILLRDPVERLYSRYYGHFVRDKLYKGSFESKMDEFKHIEKYAPAIKYYQDVFGPENVKILITEFMKKDLNSLLNQIWKFLGVSEIKIKDSSEINISGNPKSKALQKVIKSGILINNPFSKFLKLFLKKETRNKFKRYLQNINLNKKPEMKPETRLYLEKYFLSDIESIEKLTGYNLKSIWLKEIKTN